MRFISFFIVMVLLCLCPAPVKSQIDILKKAKQKTQNKINNKIDKKIDEGLEKVFNENADEEKENNQDQNQDENTNNAQEAGSGSDEERSTTHS